MPPTIQIDRFAADQPLPAAWKTFIKGTGRLEQQEGLLRLINRPDQAGDDTRYSNAQVDDYQALARRDFLWQPPLTMTVEARFSHPAGQLSGTAGFGFWNDPFLMTGLRRPALPRVIWFFYSAPPSNLKLDINTPGSGWKVGTLDAIRRPFFALLPIAPLAVPLMNIGWLYRTFWPLGQRAINVSEALVTAPMTDWQRYTIVWQKKSAHFYVDDQLILACTTPPRGPLGFVLWLDNQYMIVTPWGRFGYGLVSKTAEQWLAVRRISIEPGAVAI